MQVHENILLVISIFFSYEFPIIFPMAYLTWIPQITDVLVTKFIDFNSLLLLLSIGSEKAHVHF